METPFKKELEHKLLNDKKLAESSIKLYVRNLEKLNDNQPLKNLTFLKDVTKITEKLAHYKENTKRGYLISVTSVLSLDKSTKPKKKLYDDYFKLMLEKNKELKAEEATNTKSDTQQKNWLSWDEVKVHWDDLKTKVDSFTSKEISESQYNTLLQFVVLSLYVLLPPRRNEYQNMVVVTSVPNGTDNYLDLTKKQMVLNHFKTSKKDGSITLDVPESLQSVINLYIKYHPLIKGKITKKFQAVPFLVYYDGKPFSQVNSITRILNKTFGKKVSSSMLRSIYLTTKYGDVRQEMKDDATAMSHSVQTQQTNYVKTDKKE